MHLAFEDHRRPGSGGGGLRTHEVNRRLARKHRVTVVTTRYPGARLRLEDGVVYRPLGLNLGYFGSIISYFVFLPWFVIFQRADLIIEDFGAPISSALVPLFTRQPTVAIVQWMFAWDKSRRFKLPFFLFEECGVRLHGRFIAVSRYIAERIATANPQAEVEVVPGGASVPEGFVAPPLAHKRILYLGRLEWEHKGLDHLVDAVSRLSDLDEVRLTVAGAGPDKERFLTAARQAGVAERIDMVDWVVGEEKWSLLASSAALVVPSRYETFGLVAAEALTVGTPVVAFALPSLQEIVADGSGVLVDCYDTEALASALRQVVVEPTRRQALAKQARRQAGRFDWDRAAEAHEQVYLSAVQGQR